MSTLWRITKSVKADIQGLDFPSIEFLLAEFIQNIHSDADTMSEIIIEQRIQPRTEQYQNENSIFTPNPLEFESLADHQDVTFSFTDLPFEQSTIDSTTDSTIDLTIDNTTYFIFEFINDEMTFSPISATDQETSSATKIQTSNGPSKSPTSTTISKSATSTGVRTTASYVLSSIKTTTTFTTAISNQIPTVEKIPVTGSSISSTTFQATISTAITTKVTTSTTLQPVTSAASPTTNSTNISVTRATVTTPTKYSRKDACINFCQGTGHHKL